MTWAAVAIGGAGLVTGLAGSYLGSQGASSQAKAQIAAGQSAQQLYDTRTNEGMARQLLFAYGGPQSRQMLGASMPASSYDALFGRAAKDPTYTDAQRARLAEINTQLQRGYQVPVDQWGRPRPSGNVSASANEWRKQLEGERDTLMKAAGYDPGMTGAIDPKSWDSFGPGYLSQMSDLSKKYSNLYGNMLPSFDTDTNTILATAKQFGADRSKIIDQDAQRSLTNANRMSLAQLTGSGLGDSTLVSNAYGGNADSINRSVQSQKADLADQQSKLLTGLMSDRFGARTSLMGNVLDKQAGFEQQPLAAQMQLLTGNAFNPYLGTDTTKYYPGVSPSGASASVWGNSLSAIGGQATQFGTLAALYPQLFGKAGSTGTATQSWGMGPGVNG